MLQKIIVHLLSIGIYILGAVYCYDRGLEFLRLVVKEYESFYWHDMEAERIGFAKAHIETTARSNEIIRDMRADDPSLAEIKQNLTEQREIHQDAIRRIDAAKQQFADRSRERLQNVQSAYEQAYIPVAVVGGLIWYLLSLPVCGLITSILSFLSNAESSDTAAHRGDGAREYS